MGTVTVHKPFEEKVLRKLTINNLIKIALDHKRNGLKKALIKHLTTYRSDKDTLVPYSISRTVLK
jgi:hypothetical protein